MTLSVKLKALRTQKRESLVYAMNYEEWMDSFIPHFMVLHNTDGEECS